MTNDEIREKLNAITVYKTKLKVFIQNHFSKLYQAILENTKFLNSNYHDISLIPFAERIYCIKNNIDEAVKCEICGKPVKFNTDTGAYRKTCSISCSRKTEQTMKKFHESLARKEDPLNIQKSRITRYAKNNGLWHTADFYSKVEKTKELRYGDKCWNNSEKQRQTSIERYGVSHPMKCEHVKEIQKDSIKKLYGTDCIFKLERMREKAMKGIRRRAWKQLLKYSCASPITTEEEFITIKDINKDDCITFKCNNCGNEFKSYWDNGHARPCPHCSNFGHGSSDQEKQLVEFIMSVADNKYKVYTKNKINRNLIAPKEIDIVITDTQDNVKLGIEYDGLYWHSENIKNKKYGINKTHLCTNKNIRLIHVFENEWLSKADIVKSRIKTILGIFDKTIYARNCRVKTIDPETSRDFQNKNHIQGQVNSSVNIGLFYDDKLISIMTFGKCRFDKKHEWEMLRFCCKLGYHIPGAASKLLAYFEKNYNPKSLVSYADIRWSNGKLYHTLNFKYLHDSQPNYWYFKNHDTRYVYSRINFQKHKLKEKLEIFDPLKSEAENMKANGYSRIFDCGNMVFEKTY